MVICIHNFVLQYLTNMKLTNGNAFSGIALKFQLWNWLKTNSFTVHHVVCCCYHSNHNDWFSNLLLLFLKMFHADLYLQAFWSIYWIGQILVIREPSPLVVTNEWYFLIHTPVYTQVILAVKTGWYSPVSLSLCYSSPFSLKPAAGLLN